MVKIKLFVPAGQAKSGPPLAPILGQHQINLMEFCKLFNARSTEIYNSGIPVRLRIFKQKSSTDYQYQPITFSSLVKNFVLYITKKRILSFSQCYDILNVRLNQISSLTYNKKLIAKQMFGFFRSARITLKSVKSRKI